MKILQVKDFFDPRFHEYVIGPKETNSRGVYLSYGEVEGGRSRKLAPGEGHEEILLVVEGRGRLATGEGERAIIAGEALYLGPGFSATLHAEGEGPLRYVCAGGHVPGGHRH